MASTKISANLPPNIDPSKATLAYGREALPRLNRELGDSELVVRQRAAKALSDYLHDPEHVAAAIQEGIVDSLINLLKDNDVNCRQLSTECIYIMSQHAVGRDAFLLKQVLPPLMELFDDKEDICRKNSHLAVEMVSETVAGAEGLVENIQLIPVLIVKARDEVDEIKQTVLDTLHFCCRLKPEDALNADGMEVFTALLKHENADIRSKAARDIMDLSVPLDGKRRAVKCETVPALIKLLNDGTTDVRANAAGALSFILITVHAKYVALNAGAIPELIKVVNDASSEVRVYALKALTCLCEAPEGRKMLQDYLEQLKTLEQDQDASVIKHAKILVKVITWKP